MVVLMIMLSCLPVIPIKSGTAVKSKQNIGTPMGIESLMKPIEGCLFKFESLLDPSMVMVEETRPRIESDCEVGWWARAILLHKVILNSLRCK